MDRLPNEGRDPEVSAAQPGGVEGLVSGDARDVVRLEQLSPEAQRKVRELMSKIDAGDIHTILAFGVEAQRELTASADQILQGVRNKDTGPVGEALNDLMLKVRSTGIEDLKPGQRPNWVQRTVLRQAHPVVRFVQRYETIKQQIDGLVGRLEQHKARMLRDVTMLDKMYEAALTYLVNLELYIAAGVAKLRELDDTVLPELKAKAARTDDMIDAQNLRDMVARRDDLERRVHDLRLTRQVTLQSLPQIRLIQDVDKSLLSKIQTSILTTIPVWKSQIAIAITLWNQQQALRIQKAVTDTTNEMLARNAELLRMGTTEARKEIERGMFDIETVRKVNEELIATIEESIRIAEEGRARRKAAETELQQLEGDLRRALVEARDRP